MNKPQFLDYIKGGTQISVLVGIDFTGSNGKPTMRESLHTIHKKPNLYEKVIDSCCNIVAYYDYDQQFPTFGFGAKVDYGNIHCFPLNKNEGNPNINGVNGILETYRNF